MPIYGWRRPYTFIYDIDEYLKILILLSAMVHTPSPYPHTGVVSLSIQPTTRKTGENTQQTTVPQDGLYG